MPLTTGMMLQESKKKPAGNLEAAHVSFLMKNSPHGDLSGVTNPKSTKMGVFLEAFVKVSSGKWSTVLTGI